MLLLLSTHHHLAYCHHVDLLLKLHQNFLSYLSLDLTANPPILIKNSPSSFEPTPMQQRPKSSARPREITCATGPGQSEAYAGREMHKISHVMRFSSHFTLIPKHSLIACKLIIISKSIMIVNNYSKQSIRLNLRISCRSPFARNNNGEEDKRCTQKHASTMCAMRII